jgi:hypothetical protein
VHRLLRDRLGRQGLVNARCGVLIVRMVVMPMARRHGLTFGSVSACAARAGRDALDLRKRYDDGDESGPNHAFHLGLRVAHGSYFFRSSILRFPSDRVAACSATSGVFIVDGNRRCAGAEGIPNGQLWNRDRRCRFLAGRPSYL